MRQIPIYLGDKKIEKKFSQISKTTYVFIKMGSNFEENVIEIWRISQIYPKRIQKKLWE